MPKQLIPLTISAPGFLGLNTQQAGSILPPGWATKLDNCVFDNIGRIASRKGTQQVHEDAISGTPTMRSGHEYVDRTGQSIMIWAGDNKIWKEVLGTVTDITGTITTPTADNWQFANFNDWCVGYQAGHEPIFLENTSDDFIDAADFGGADTKTMYNGIAATSAYGRTWTVLNNTLYYTDLLIHSYAGGSSGSFDLAKFWPSGMDTAVAVKDFNGLLIVFGRESVLIYENADDVGNMALIEGIDGVGCIARDSVQAIGKDLVYLSDTGLRSLGRSVIDQQAPLSDISSHVRANLLADADVGSSDDIKSAYHPVDGFYVISFPNRGRSWYFDLKFPNEDGTWKAATWDLAPTAMAYTRNNVLNMAVTSGYVSAYTGYLDESSVGASDGASYLLDYEGVWNDMSQEAEGVENLLKIPKSVSVLGSSGANAETSFKWTYDYSAVFQTAQLAFTSSAAVQFGVGVYGVSTFTNTDGTFERVRASLASSGQVIKTGIVAVTDGEPFALQRIDMLVKIGRLYI